MQQLGFSPPGKRWRDVKPEWVWFVPQELHLHQPAGGKGKKREKGKGSSAKCCWKQGELPGDLGHSYIWLALLDQALKCNGLRRGRRKTRNQGAELLRSSPASEKTVRVVQGAPDGTSGWWPLPPPWDSWCTRKTKLGKFSSKLRSNSLLFLAKTQGKWKPGEAAAASFFKGLGVSAEPQMYLLGRTGKENKKLESVLANAPMQNSKLYSLLFIYLTILKYLLLALTKMKNIGALYSL